MRLPRHSSRQQQQAGYGVLIVMGLLVVLLIIFASVMNWSESSAKITWRNNLFNQSENAAESSTENILAYMMRDFNAGPLNSSAFYSTNFPPTNGWPIYFQFSDTSNNTANAATVTIGSLSTSATNLGSQFAGLYGFAMPCTIASTAMPMGQNVSNFSATISQTIQFTLIPLFQFAIFYNMDLEINPGAGMAINGHVHSNNAIWATGEGSGSSELIFSNYVEAASGITFTRSTNDPSYSSTTNGNVVFAITNNNPLGNANVLSLPIGSVSANNSPTNVQAILDPPPSAYAPPNYGAAYSGAGTNYLENEADLIITNPPTGLAVSHGTNISVFYQNLNNSPNYQLTVLPDVPVMTIITNSSPSYKATNINYAFFSYVTNVSYYDYREGKTVQALQISITNLNIWLTNQMVLVETNRIITLPFNGSKLSLSLLGSTNTGTNSLFIDGTNVLLLAYYGNVSLNGTNYNTVNSSNSITFGGQQYNNLKMTGSTEISSTKGINSIYAINAVAGTNLPAVRMVNGQQLPPYGLTIATPNPIYVLGSYNDTRNGSTFSKTLGDTTNTYPAALMGDAVTILSSNWSDSYSTANSTTSRTTAGNNTVINAATLEGIVTSVTNGTGSTTASANNHYSGGVENFLRLEENWTNALVYNGSIIVMFPSQYATNYWQNTYSSGNSTGYYNPPTRQWGFDLNFNISSNLPPLTPQIKATIRGTWSAW